MQPMQPIQSIMSPSFSTETIEQSYRILELIFERRRLLSGELEKEGNFFEEAEFHLNKIINFVLAGEPIHMILPAFPAKSPSRQKTLGHLPDHGEELAFRNLEDLCNKIKNIYAPGASITICSDGRVFADVVRIPDIDVTEYNDKMKLNAKEWNLASISFFDLDDVFPKNMDFSILREELMMEYGERLMELQERCRNEPQAREMYKGITKFLFEDFCGMGDFSGWTRTAIQNAARISAYRVIQRSNAWGRLLADRFKNSLRLSIHPQFRCSEKIGINLISESDCWTTPWHSVVLKKGEKIMLVKRKDAEDMNATLVFRAGKPSHYALEV